MPLKRCCHYRQGNPRQYWILDSMPWVLDSKYWIPDSNSKKNSGFLELYSRFHEHSFSGFRNPLHEATVGVVYGTDWSHGERFMLSISHLFSFLSLVISVLIFIQSLKSPKTDQYFYSIIIFIRYRAFCEVHTCNDYNNAVAVQCYSSKIVIVYNGEEKCDVRLPW